MSIGICFDDGFSINYYSAEYNVGKKDGYEQGRRDERKKIMEIIDSADDIAQAMYLLGQYIIAEEMNVEDK